MNVIQEILIAVGFKDRKDDPILPKWESMKQLLDEQLFHEGAGMYIHESASKQKPKGCVYTNVGGYISHRYAGEHGLVSHSYMT